MIAPAAIVGQVHAGLAGSGRLDPTAIQVDAGFVEERLGLPGPDAQACLIEDLEQDLNMGVAETPAEVPGRGWVGNAAGAERVEEDFVLATEFEVFQTRPTAQGVVGDVYPVIGFVVGQRNLKQVQRSGGCPE